MSQLIKNALVIDSSSAWDGKQVDILIESGRIKKIGKNLKSSSKTVSSENLCVSPGWIDMKVRLQDPGYEHKEDIISGLSAAKKGGFTSVVTMPGTKPVTDSKSGIDYVLNKAKGRGVRVYPAGALSKNMEGFSLSEMFDMSQAGAKLFTDDTQVIGDAGLMKKALLYVKNFGGTIAALPMDRSLSPDAQVHEGAVSTALGLKGIPSVAEEMMLKRDIDLLRYTESRLHVSGITTAGGVKLIAAAKKEGLHITAEVHLANLIWTDEAIREYDSNFKMMPPLREESDRKALVKAVESGVIDCISSNHSPEDMESKKLEFGLANYGSSMLESFFGLYSTHLADVVSLNRFVDCLTQGPAKVLGFKSASIEVGKRAIITCFDPTLEWTYKASSSKAYNDVAEGSVLVGKVI